MVLPKSRIFIPENYAPIFKTFENVAYIEQLRQKWEKIKKLQAPYIYFMAQLH